MRRNTRSSNRRSERAEADRSRSERNTTNRNTSSRRAGSRTASDNGSSDRSRTTRNRTERTQLHRDRSERNRSQNLSSSDLTKGGFQLFDLREVKEEEREAEERARALERAEEERKAAALREQMTRMENSYSRRNTSDLRAADTSARGIADTGRRYSSENASQARTGSVEEETQRRIAAAEQRRLSSLDSSTPEYHRISAAQPAAAEAVAKKPRRKKARRRQENPADMHQITAAPSRQTAAENNNPEQSAGDMTYLDTAADKAARRSFVRQTAASAPQNRKGAKALEQTLSSSRNFGSVHTAAQKIQTEQSNSRTAPKAELKGMDDFWAELEAAKKREEEERVQREIERARAQEIERARAQEEAIAKLKEEEAKVRREAELRQLEEQELRRQNEIAAAQWRADEAARVRAEADRMREIQVQKAREEEAERVQQREIAKIREAQVNRMQQEQQENLRDELARLQKEEDQHTQIENSLNDSLSAYEAEGVLLKEADEESKRRELQREKERLTSEASAEREPDSLEEFTFDPPVEETESDDSSDENAAEDEVEKLSAKDKKAAAPGGFAMLLHRISSGFSRKKQKDQKPVKKKPLSDPFTSDEGLGEDGKYPDDDLWNDDEFFAQDADEKRAETPVSEISDDDLFDAIEDSSETVSTDEDGWVNDGDFYDSDENRSVKMPSFLANAIGKRSKDKKQKKEILSPRKDDESTDSEIMEFEEEEKTSSDMIEFEENDKTVPGITDFEEDDKTASGIAEFEEDDKTASGMIDFEEDDKTVSGMTESEESNEKSASEMISSGDEQEDDFDDEFDEEFDDDDFDEEIAFPSKRASSKKKSQNGFVLPSFETIMEAEKPRERKDTRLSEGGREKSEGAEEDESEIDSPAAMPAEMNISENLKTSESNFPKEEMLSTAGAAESSASNDAPNAVTDSKSSDARTKKSANRRKYDSMLGKITAGVLAGVMVLNLILPDSQSSEIENRELSQVPSVSLTSITDGSFSEKVEEWQSDQFIGRNVLRNLKTYLTWLGGNREEQDVYFGKDGQLLEKIVEPEEELLQANTASINAFAEKYPDKRYGVMLVPDAGTILTDSYPAFSNQGDQRGYFGNVKSLLSEQILWVDTLSALDVHTDEKLYYKTDHHWTSLGANYGYQVFCETFGLQSGSFTVNTISNTFNGALSSTSGFCLGEKETIEMYVPDAQTKVVVTNPEDGSQTATLYNTDKLSTKDQYAVFLGGNYPLVDIKTTTDTDQVLLLFKDSFANSMLPFLVTQYKEIVVVDPRYYSGDIAEVMLTYGISDVCFLYSGNTFFADHNLEGVLNQEV